MIRNINTDVYSRLGLVSSDENDNFSDRVSKYTEVLNNKNYSIFLENVTLKTTINDYISNSSRFVSRAEDGNGTKKNFFRKIIDRILEILDKFLDWLYRVQIKIVTSRLFKKVNSMLENLKKRFKVYPINIKVKKYIKEDFIDNSDINDKIDKYKKEFEQNFLLLKESFKKVTEVSEKLRKELDNTNEFYRKMVLKLDFDVSPIFQLPNLHSLKIIPIEFIKRPEEEKYITIKIANKEEDKKIRRMLHEKVRRIRSFLEVVDRQFKEITKLANDAKLSLKELVEDLDRKKIDNKLTINAVTERYRLLNDDVTYITKNTSKVIQDSNKRLTKELDILETDLSEFLK